MRSFLLTLNSINSLISPFSIINYQLSIVNSLYPHARKRHYKTNAQTDKFIIFEKIFISLSMQRG